MNLANIEADIVKQVAMRCSDPFMKDHVPEVYEQALFYTDKKIARRYSILHRYYKVNSVINQPPENTNANYADEMKKTNLELDLPGFKNEYLVMVNDLEYIKEPANHLRKIEDSYYYQLYRDQNTIKFNYTPRGVNDDVYIYYLSDPDLIDYEDETTRPIIPSKYEDERVELTMVEIARIGYAKFSEDKQKKYEKILKTHQDTGFKTELAERKGTIRIHPWKYP